MNLFISLFNHPDEQRQKEFDFCLNENAKNPLIDNILIFYEHWTPDDILPPKCKIIGNNRPTYQDFFDATANFPQDINIIANADIAFNGTLEMANKIRPRECFAITRHEWRDGRIEEFDGGGAKGAPAGWSQDVWIFRGFVNIQGCDVVLAQNQQNQKIYDEIKFWLGIGGCDNVIATKIRRSGYSILNPYRSIECIHPRS